MATVVPPSQGAAEHQQNQAQQQRLRKIEEEPKQQKISSDNGDWRSKSPGKALWGLIAVGDLLGRSLGLSFYFLPKGTRQDREWTWRQAYTTGMLRASFEHMTHTKLVFPISMEPGAEGDRFIVLKPAEQNRYIGIFHDDEIKPTPIGATWYPTQPSDEARSNGPTILHFHGGSFLWATGRDSDCKFTGNSLASHLGGYALLVQYRLAFEVGCSFPAPFQDALTAYTYLLDSGVKAENIILSGDSAGALLALGLLRHLSSSTDGTLPLPRACLLFSPSVDLTIQGDANAIDTHRNNGTDFLTGSTLAWGVAALLGTQSRDTPHFAPARYSFKTSVPIFVQGGSDEVLTDTYTMFVQRMREIEGNRIDYHEVPHAPHDILFVGHIIGWQEAVKAVLSAARAFIDS